MLLAFQENQEVNSLDIDSSTVTDLFHYNHTSNFSSYEYLLGFAYFFLYLNEYA